MWIPAMKKIQRGAPLRRKWQRQNGPSLAKHVSCGRGKYAPKSAKRNGRNGIPEIEKGKMAYGTKSDLLGARLKVPKMAK